MPPAASSFQKVLAGAESTVRHISEFLTENDQCKAGIFGVTDKLEIVSVQTFPHRLHDVVVGRAVHEAMRANATAIIAFDIVDESRFRAQESAISRLAESCEEARTCLLDVILYSPEKWASMRQQNLL
jgi:hypothetical protein